MILIHILPNISRSKGNQAIELAQLIKYSVRNIFLPKIIQKMSQGEWFQFSFHFLKRIILGQCKQSAPKF